jgi:hypothetical protein
MSRQLPRMSLWLQCYIAVGGLTMIFLSPMLKWRALGGSFRDAFWTVYREEAVHGPQVTDFLFCHDLDSSSGVVHFLFGKQASHKRR